MNKNQIISHWIKTQDVKSLLIYHFKLEPEEVPTPTQCRMIRDIIFRGCRRALWRMMTRYGKSYTAAFLIGLYICLNVDKRINIIGPQISQCKIIMKNFTKLIPKSKILSKLLPITGKRIDTFGKEVTQASLMFDNGCSVFLIGVNGEGASAMGEGGDLNIVDEMGLIDKKTFDERVFRLLGDNAATSIMVGLYNPWGTDNIAADLDESPRWKTWVVDWKIALKEGRTTQDYIDEKRETLTETAFTVLYDAEFPKMAIDTILTKPQVQEMFDRDVTIVGSPHIEIGVDVARFGKDKTVIVCRRGMKVFHIEKNEKEDTMQTSGRVAKLAKDFSEQGYEIIISIDDTGLGGGVTDRLNELGEEWTIIPVINGSTDTDNEKYVNKITELWMWFKENYHMVDLPADTDIMAELTKRRYKYTSDGQKIIIESKKDFKKRLTKSPDTMDAVANAFASETTDIHDFAIGGFV